MAQHIETTAAEIELAIEAFAKGFSYTRSFTHPYVAERVGPLWVMRDAERKNKKYRREEWIAWGVEPEKVKDIIQRHTRGGHAICLIAGEGEEERRRAEYKAIGYRLQATEPMMVHWLERIPRLESPAEVVRVRDEELAEKLNEAAGSRQVAKEHLASDTPLRQYAALLDGQVVGWVRSIDTGKATWCSNMFVRPEFRRRGIAKAMLCQLLRDDRKFGAEAAVLTASHTGAMLYPLVGYQQVATLLLYCPKRG